MAIGPVGRPLCSELWISGDPPETLRVLQEIEETSVNETSLSITAQQEMIPPDAIPRLDIMHSF
jgi:hypothetical protein